MHAGRIAQLGPPSEVYEFPVSRLVAEFIGQVNLFEGRLAVDEPDYAVIVSEEAGCELQIGRGVAGAVGMRFWVAVRPEKIRMTAEPLRAAANAAAANAAAGRIEEIAYLGGLSTYLVRLDSGKLVRASAPNLERWSEHPFTWGDRVQLSWSESAGVVLAQ
jgi:putrescine transport system ATP-binding protein